MHLQTFQKFMPARYIASISPPLSSPIAGIMNDGNMDVSESRYLANVLNFLEIVAAIQPVIFDLESSLYAAIRNMLASDARRAHRLHKSTDTIEKFAHQNPKELRVATSTITARSLQLKMTGLIKNQIPYKEGLRYSCITAP